MAVQHVAPNESRMIADRFRRVWALVQLIADEPGMTRADLARRFHLSERQVQTDLNMIRVDMRLPLIRRMGYRFADEGGASVGAGALNIHDLLRLVAIVEAGRRSAVDIGDDLGEKLANLAPLHLRALARELLLGAQRAWLWKIVQAVLSGGDRAVRVMNCRGGTDTVQPELIVPFRGLWWLVGLDVKTARHRMWRVDQVTTVEPVAIRLERKRAAS